MTEIELLLSGVIIHGEEDPGENLERDGVILHDCEIGGVSSPTWCAD